MGPWLATLVLATMTLTPAAVEKDGVRIEVSLESHKYIWTVTNVDAPPIMSFDFGHHNTYNHNLPLGWQYEDVDGRIRTWTDDGRYAIRPGQSASFDARFASSGAVLGTVPAAVGFGPDQPPVVFEQVWGPVPKLPGFIALVAVVVAAIAIVHLFLAAWRDRRKAAAGPSAA